MHTKLTSGNRTIFNKYDMPNKYVCDRCALRDILFCALLTKYQDRDENNIRLWSNCSSCFLLFVSCDLQSFVTIELYSINFVSQCNFPISALRSIVCAMFNWDGGGGGYVLSAFKRFVMS